MNQRIINQITRATWINKIKRLRYYPDDNFNIPINIMTSIIISNNNNRKINAMIYYSYYTYLSIIE